MPSIVPLLGFLLSVGLVAADEKETGCTITAQRCKNFPEFQRAQFRDGLGEEHLAAGSVEAACLKRAEDFHHWCGNGVDGGAQVAATYNPAKWSQIYHPGACDAGWSLWDAFCFKHYWEKRNWFEAEKLCRDRDSHLASIHSTAENRFVFTLTSGLSAWIGYTDLDQDTHYKWSDNTQDDFTNFAKNCTGRETEPDCKPEERKQQWYDWQGGDAGTFVCKRNARLPGLSVLRNVTGKELRETAWDVLLPALAIGGMGAGEKAGDTPSLPALELKTPSIPLAKDTDGSTKLPATPIAAPVLAAPKGLASFL